jgi:Transglutaminase-like superfamily
VDLTQEFFMRRSFAAVCFWLVCLAPTLRAAEPEGKLLRDTWMEIRTEQGKLGSLHMSAREFERDGKKLIRTEQAEELFFLRSGDPYNEKQILFTLETPAGEVLELGYTTTLSKKQELKVHGKVEGKEVVFRVLGDDEKITTYTQKVPWDRAALGLFAEDSFFQRKQLKTGEKHSLKAFNISCNRVATTNFAVKGPEKTKLGKEERELTRIEQSYPKELYLSKSTLWLDEAGLIAKMQEDSPLFGLVTYERVDKEVAEKKFKPRVADIEAPVQVINPLKFKNGAPKELLVRISLEGEDEPGTLFVQDDRQKVVKADDKAVDLRLLGINATESDKEKKAAAAKDDKPKEEKKTAPAAEYLESNFFIRSDDPLVVKLAKEAVGDEKDPRKQAKAIRRWVGKHVKGSYEVAFATADEVARTCEGDCSEMGVLCAAMCRAVGVPSRVCFGIVYDPNNPGFGGHLWSEVYLDGHWETCDPTGVTHLLNAAHIKVADYSMAGVLNPDELVAVRRVFAGKMKVEILEHK